MTHEPLPTGPDPEAIQAWILERWPATDVFAMPDGVAVFFSLDPERHFPNFATIVKTDDFDQVSDLSRPGVFRLSVGALEKATFERLVGGVTDPEYAALDRLQPHPDYAKQRYVAILNPSEATFRDVIVPLLTEAHDRMAAARARHQPAMR